jgi:hypothetical protein
MAAPTINYTGMVPSELSAVRAERDRAQQDCQRMGEQITALRGALLKITAIIETQSEPDIDAMHDVAREALSK